MLFALLVVIFYRHLITHFCFSFKLFYFCLHHCVASL